MSGHDVQQGLVATHLLESQEKELIMSLKWKMALTNYRVYNKCQQQGLKNRRFTMTHKLKSHEPHSLAGLRYREPWVPLTS